MRGVNLFLQYSSPLARVCAGAVQSANAWKVLSEELLGSS
jgi:hypothetical protein